MIKMNEEYLKGLTKEELIKIIDDETTCTYQLKNNWNELKKFIISTRYNWGDEEQDNEDYDLTIEDILNKMQELEGNNE